jgi:hypothetical protein
VKARPNLRFIGLNVDDTTANAKAFVKKYGWKWPSIKDPERKLEAKLGGSYQPFIALINPKGEIAGRFVGPGKASDWQRLLDRARR